MSDNAPIYFFFTFHRLGDNGAPHGLTAKVIGDCTAEKSKDAYLFRIEKPHILSTRTVDCELVWLQNFYMRYLGGVI